VDAENAVDGHGFAGKSGDLPGTEHIAIGDSHASGTVTLSDSASGNVPDLATYVALAASLSRWGRSAINYCFVVRSTVPGVFSVGYGTALSNPDPVAARAHMRAAYTLTWALDCFTKPAVPLIDGAVSGAGAGLSVFGTHKVAGRGYRFSMPGPAIGWFPDHGMSHVFSRMPDAIGTYLALTGAAIGRADAYRLGLLTQCIDADKYNHIARCLSDADCVDPLLDDLHIDAGVGELEPRRETIARCFSADTVQEMAARLRAVTGTHAAWAGEVAGKLMELDPVAAAITLRLLREARGLDLRQTLMLDYRIASRLLAARASLAQPADTSDSAIARYFAPLEDAELPLLTRAEMQATGP
jgi:enoyl-CoA hydratase